MGNNFSSQSAVLMYSSFFLESFPKLLRSTPFFSKPLHCVYIPYINNSYIILSQSAFYDLLVDFVLICIHSDLLFMLYDFMGFVKCQVLSIHYYFIVQNNCAILKNLLCFTQLVLSPKTPGEFNLFFISAVLPFPKCYMNGIID